MIFYLQVTDSSEAELSVVVRVVEMFSKKREKYWNEKKSGILFECPPVITLPDRTPRAIWCQLPEVFCFTRLIFSRTAPILAQDQPDQQQH